MAIMVMNSWMTPAVGYRKQKGKFDFLKKTRNNKVEAKHEERPWECFFFFKAMTDGGLLKDKEHLKSRMK